MILTRFSISYLPGVGQSSIYIKDPAHFGNSSGSRIGWPNLLLDSSAIICQDPQSHGIRLQFHDTSSAIRQSFHLSGAWKLE